MRRWLAIPLAATLASQHAAAQDVSRFGIGADVGAAIPLGSFRSDGARTGVTVGATATMRLTDLVGLYASAEQTAIGVKSTAVAPGDGTWNDTGFGAGVRVKLFRPRPRRLLPWAQVGIASHTLDAPISSTAFRQLDGKRIQTFEGGAGMDIALGARNRWFLRPVLRYRRYDFSVQSASVTQTSRATYLAAGVGLVMAIGPRSQDAATR